MQYPAAYPPTPTMIPPGTPYFDPVPDSYGLWAAADPALQFYYYFDDIGAVIQIIVLLLLIGAGLYTLYRFILDFTQRDSNQ
jgi:hypothetical protein